MENCEFTTFTRYDVLPHTVGFSTCISYALVGEVYEEVNVKRSECTVFERVEVREDESLNDVVFKVEDRFFKANSSLLATRSEFFKVMFTQTYSDKSFIELNDINADAFETVVASIYGGRTSFKDMYYERIVDILQVSHYFLCEDLVKGAMEALTKIIDFKNVLQIFEVASCYSIKKLTTACLEIISHNSLELLNDDYCLDFTPKVFKEFISSDCLYAPEIEIFRAVQRWLEVNPEIDSRQEITSQIRLKRLSILDIIEIHSSNLFDEINTEQSSHSVQQKYPERGRLDKDRIIHGSVVETKLGIIRSKSTMRTMNFYECPKMKQTVFKLSDFYLVNSILLETGPKNKVVTCKCCYSDEEIQLSLIDDNAFCHPNNMKCDMTDMEFDSTFNNNMDCDMTGMEFDTYFNNLRLNFPAKVVKYIGIAGYDAYFDTYFKLKVLYDSNQ